jgi:uncharacterized membrane protein YkoI
MRKLRTKRVIIPAAVFVAALGAGSVAWATSAGADIGGGIGGDERDRVANAATQAVPGAVQEVETSDDRGEAYEVEIRRPDGVEVEVVLDKDLRVLSSSSSAGSDDRVLTAAERASASRAALDAVGGGTITDVEADDDAAYEVEVRAADNTEWDVDLDEGFNVLRKTAD